VIEIDDLSVRYSGGVVALKRTTKSFRRGEFAVLLGPSGAGKSTFLRALNGLVRPTSGTVSIAGLGSIADRGNLQRHRRRTGMIFQQHQLIGRLTALTNVLIGRLGHHTTLRSLFPLPQADRRLALECLDRVGLVDRALERVDRLSGGQQQRVGIARATAQQPEIILADEPVASLDPATAVEVLGRLHAICKADGLTAIVSLHQVSLARQFADRIIGLVAGEVVFDGKAAELTDFDLERIYTRIPPAMPAQRVATMTPLLATSASLAIKEI
jgi:phosphonate transport system ATP-binding protein